MHGEWVKGHSRILAAFSISRRSLVEIPSTHLQFVIDYLHEHSADIATFVGMSTFFLTIILSFRVNQAYNRWWEARTLWGAMINDTRDMAVKALVHGER